MAIRFVKRTVEWCKETQRRCCVAVWAWSYEVYNHSIVDDATFDRVCKEIDLSISTGNKKMDKWFKENFQPHTGQWVHNHPNKKRLDEIVQSLMN